MPKDPSSYDYDVCLSFAGENREYVEDVASELRERGLRVFYDKYEDVQLWGKDLYVHLDDVYRNTARYCVLFISHAYRDKLWTNHERQSAQARAFQENQDYLLPVRFDDTEIPGFRETVGYVDISDKSAAELAAMIETKVGTPNYENYFPPNPVGLFEFLGVEDTYEKGEVSSCAFWFFTGLRRMTPDEREVIFRLFMDGCPAELPDNIHISQDLLSRATGFAIRKLRRMLGAVSSLGFRAYEREEEENDHLGHGKVFIVELHDMREEGLENATIIANAVIMLVAMKYCEDHAIEYLRRLDFSPLTISVPTEDET